MLHDGSSAEEIKEKVQMSKKAFKQVVGQLYKQQKILILPDRLRLVKKS
jgi:predicted RNA-binding protein (virulence factor B family)